MALTFDGLLASVGLDATKIKKTAGKFGKRFVFGLFLEDKHKEIISEVQKWLEPYSSAEIHQLIKDNKFPFVPPDIFQMVGEDVGRFIDSIDAGWLFEFLAEARSDLAEAVDSEGDAGYRWFNRMRNHFAACVKNSSLAQAQPPVMADKVVMVECDTCHKRFPLPKTEAVKLEKCPGCGAPAK